jgi:tetratricopeptide (TPR) repeat protein
MARPDPGSVRVWPAAALLVLAGLLAWSNSFQGELIFDDIPCIEENPTIRDLWSLPTVLSPPGQGVTVQGRPILNLSLAINYALGGTSTWGYHVFNLAIHLAAGMTLLGVVRRTLLLESFQGRFTRAATGLALAVALIWTLHPLQTESVTYVIQRAESLAGLWYFLTLYCFIRGLAGPRRRGWQVAAVVACALGMATKEVLVSTPLIVLLYDRVFVSPSFAVAIKRRWPVFAGLAATWLLLAYLVIGAQGRGGTAGLGGEVTTWQYLLTQGEAIPMYLKLCFWPSPLVLDYGKYLAPVGWHSLAGGGVVLLLLAATLASFRRWPWVGFLGVWFFATLAPTSSFVPVVTQTMAEHRMYLPLAAVAVLVVFTAQALWLRWRGGTRQRKPAIASSTDMPAGLVVLGTAIVIVLGSLTWARNRDYRTELAIYQDTVRKRPDNPRAHNSVGQVLLDQGDIAGAIEAFDRSIALETDARAITGRGNALKQLGNLEAALADYDRAIANDPQFHSAWFNRGVLLAEMGQIDQALADYTQAIELRPESPKPYHNRAALFSQMGRLDDALADYARAIELEPGNADAWYSRGTLWARMNRPAEAIADLTRAIELDPESSRAHTNRAAVRQQQGDTEGALADYARDIALQPGNPRTYLDRAALLARLDRPREAEQDLTRVIQLDPRSAVAYGARATLRAQRGDTAGALADVRAAQDLGGTFDEAFLEQLGQDKRLELEPSREDSTGR